MKKIVFMIAAFIASIAMVKAQTYTIQVTPELSFQQVFVCLNQYSTVEIYAIDGCDQFIWITTSGNFDVNPLVFDGNQNNFYGISFSGCGYDDIYFDVYFIEPNVPNETSTTLWKHQGYPLPLEAIGADSLEMYDYHWSTGETTPTIEVSEPDIYTCGISDQCATATRTFIVRDNVEIYRSGVDPATNKNRVLWQTTPEQAAYISNVKVERDGMVVGTVPYLDGQFLDNIGSENAARIYRITAIASDGTECPIPSYQFGTFNTIYSPDIANPNLMNFSWEDPFIEEGSPYEVIAYRIGRVDNSGEFIVIDQLSANVHLGKYDMDLFNGDYGIVAAVFNDAKNRDYEELAFSNRSDNGIVGIGEQNGENFGIYPNPAKDCFTVEGTGVITVTNTLGQTILTQEIDGKATIELPQGIYFVKLNGQTRKIVVE